MLVLSGIELGWAYGCIIQYAILILIRFSSILDLLRVVHFVSCFILDRNCNDAASDEEGIVMHETMMAIRGTKQNVNKTTLAPMTREKADRLRGKLHTL